jgi:hypothetical protein
MRIIVIYNVIKLIIKKCIYSSFNNIWLLKYKGLYRTFFEEFIEQ